MADSVNILYPPAACSDSGMLDVGDGYSVYWEESGNHDGPAVIFLHGGPGAGCAPAHRRFFDADHWRIILFDQRGCGRSTPTADISANTTQHLIADIEALRMKLAIDNWLVFGGSWGALLALAYGIAHPDRCRGFVLRGIFLGHNDEVDWFMNGMGRFFPDAERAFLAALPETEHDERLSNFHRRLSDPDPQIHRPAAIAWSNYESGCVRLLPSNHMDTSGTLALARLEAHYFVNDMFLPENYVLDNLPVITHLPLIIVQGRYDIICPLYSAEKLAMNWPGATLNIVADAGHSAFEPGIMSKLVEATNDMKSIS